MKNVIKSRLVAVDGSKVMVLKKAGDSKKYSLPGGVKKTKETKEQALVRETSEEIKLQLTIDQIQFFLSLTKTINTQPTNRNYFYMFLKQQKIEVIEKHKFESVIWIDWKMARQHMDKYDSLAVTAYFKSIIKKEKPMMNANFHLALPCNNIEETREFYVDIIKSKLGRSTEKWLDVNLYGNQLTFTQAGHFNFDYKNYKLDDFVLPSFHFGVIVKKDVWNELYTRLFKMDLEVTTEAIFMEGSIGEHLSFFVQDPNGYMLEFKSFKNEEDVFKSN